MWCHVSVRKTSNLTLKGRLNTVFLTKISAVALTGAHPVNSHWNPPYLQELTTSFWGMLRFSSVVFYAWVRSHHMLVYCNGSGWNSFLPWNGYMDGCGNVTRERKGNVTRAHIHKVLGSKWMKFQLWVNYLFKGAIRHIQLIRVQEQRIWLCKRTSGMTTPKVSVCVVLVLLVYWPHDHVCASKSPLPACLRNYWPWPAPDTVSINKK